MKRFSRYKNSSSHLKQNGFSLIEIMIVVVIIATLATFVAPKLLNKPNQAKVTVAKAAIQSISSSLDLYKLDNGFYPTTDQGLEALVKKPEIDPIPENWNSYYNKMPLDPWGNQYVYIQPGNHGLPFDLYSLGANGIEDGTGINADIVNWDLDGKNKE